MDVQTHPSVHSDHLVEANAMPSYLRKCKKTASENLDPDASVHGSPSNGPQRRWWSLACLDLSGSSTIIKDQQSGSKIVITLIYNCHFVMPGLEVLKYQFIYVHKASKTMNLSSHFSIAETSGSETWQNSCTTCVWSGSSASCEYSHECN